jgi:hypothetical protein
MSSGNSNFHYPYPWLKGWWKPKFSQFLQGLASLNNWRLSFSLSAPVSPLAIKLCPLPASETALILQDSPQLDLESLLPTHLHSKTRIIHLQPNQLKKRSVKGPIKQGFLSLLLKIEGILQNPITDPRTPANFTSNGKEPYFLIRHYTLNSIDYLLLSHTPSAAFEGANRADELIDLPLILTYYLYLQHKKRISFPIHQTLISCEESDLLPAEYLISSTPHGTFDPAVEEILDPALFAKASALTYLDHPILQDEEAPQLQFLLLMGILRILLWGGLCASSIQYFWT